mmetsp:Transcript_93001/g.259988  ORF Transcript_93001/g.259988 Transcript_93001/m.259988 type:complete len:299 (-) Transcript_93001:41-937(-)
MAASARRAALVLAAIASRLIAAEAKDAVRTRDIPSVPKEGFVAPAAGERASPAAAQPCLCTFDVDRTLTGKQGDIGECPDNKVTQAVDTAYGGGRLTLSSVGQSFCGTFCSQCYVGIVTAGDASGFESEERALLVQRLHTCGHLVSTSWTGPSARGEARRNCSGASIDSPLVVGCADGTKHFAVARIAEWLKGELGVNIERSRTWHFDDRSNNIAEFGASGFNARQVSCKTRDMSVLGLCGATPSEISDALGVSQCPPEQGAQAIVPSAVRRVQPWGVWSRLYELWLLALPALAMLLS